ncbi:ankyrin repeat-containing protein BDA1-like [Pistacia vera]|uniref:ankyrin repeat-containing protein BDA1-like n=1 Tax=Pistacia vera TaxID=55513 RepID=UPI001263D295|nr:ankyrin repeat-containing protein BDA1-like [Pistacia vera]
MDERLQRLQNSAAEGDVDTFFSILAEDPFVLERIDGMPWASTPLHTAVSGEKIHFAKEIVNLQPSFASKRDHLERSPLHLALEKGHGELVTWLITSDSDLVRVKGKGMLTPLHYAAQIDDEKNLADFLYVCPSSIKDLTAKSETAVHVALKSRSFKAFKVLLGWLRHFDQEEILRWEDEEGNNALYTAISENQPEMVKLLIRYLDVNRKNSKGWTALDIFHDRRDSLNAEVERILLCAKAKRASQHPDPRLNYREKFETNITAMFFGYHSSLVDYLREKLPIVEKIMKNMMVGDRIINRVPLKVQNVVLVVAILTATATYQAALVPPGGFWQDDDQGKAPRNNNNNNNFLGSYSKFTMKERSQHLAGHMVLGSIYRLDFLHCNTVAFATSVCTILIVTIGLRFSKIVALSTTLMVIAYCIALTETAPFQIGSVSWYLFYPFMFIVGFVAYVIPLFLFIREKLLKFYGREQVSMGSLEQPKM